MKTPAPDAAASSNPARKRTKTRPAARRRTTENTYSDPALRERLKTEIRSAAKGGEPGTWSARKSQLLTLAYQKAGGGYIQRHPNSKEKNPQKEPGQNAKAAAAKAARRATAPTPPSATKQPAAAGKKNAASKAGASKATREQTG
ncbi:hypothetical protein E4631_12565 [Hymenobacter sp. UV11]|uniref:hypothetical protein n=1 Tax=Hymenobacter sp. UV11 TaxID=1849735 RepID=UPI00105B3B23|nr:hypothetical protein [Hymenobacter sp. UV11]TDN38989.1 hypothetical protein A8B98_21040 [Hymenobacter sp. UV11]TFZ65928.1 hypothetical protein E4631_12565 [Hymenobacter sp. UV11]